jgi:YggT family protein
MQFLDVFFNITIGIFLLRLILNEISPSPFNPAIRLLHTVTEPILSPIRKILPDSLKYKLNIDISPIIAILLIIALKLLAMKMLSLLFSQLKGKPVKPQFK